MTIDLICVACGQSQAAHNLGSRCPDIARYSPGFMLLDSHALDDVPPARRALERARLAQEQHDRRMNVQLRFDSEDAIRHPDDGAST